MAINVSLGSAKTNKVNKVNMIKKFVIKFIIGVKPLLTTLETSERTDLLKTALL